VSLLKIGNKKPQYYKGILIRADEGLHQQAIDLLRKHVRTRSRVLDVGAGNGALSLRMLDEGYLVEAIDLDCRSFQPGEHISCSELDLNSYEARHSLVQENREKYDAATAIEVIEHLHDPWSFVAFCRALLKPGGKLLLTTPNITSFPSRILFLTSGRFHQFEDADESYGHVNPVSPHQLELILREADFKILEKNPAGNLPLLWVRRDPRFCLRWAAAVLLYPLMRQDKDGWCLLYMVQKREALD
jgi:2-polyprenyl-3-methyl-5-hydroxy-6-metoxy-1,4-benzoquinol methylase